MKSKLTITIEKNVLERAESYALKRDIINHLNHSLKEITEKSTSTLINERIISEPKALLQHTNRNISEIAFALDFEYPTYFNNFFKKSTDTNPKAFREVTV